MPDSEAEKKSTQTAIATPSLETVYGTFARALQTQLNDAVANFLLTLSDEQIDEFLPAEMADLDIWIEKKLSTYQNAEEPSPAQLVEASATLFFAAFCEELDTIAIDEDPPEHVTAPETGNVSGADADNLNDVVGA